MTIKSKSLVALCLALCAGQNAYGDTLVLNPVADTRISQITGESSMNFNGLTSTTIHGSPGNGVYAMDAGLFQFDVSSLPSGVVVTSVTFSIYIEAAAGNAYFNFRELTSDWVSSETTWTLAKTGVPWTAAGGDVSTLQLGNVDILTTDIGKYKTYASNSDFVTIVQRWIDSPSYNCGIILRRLNGSTAQYATYTSVEGNVAQRPKLTIGYIPVPAPVTADVRISSLGTESTTNFEGQASMTLHGSPYEGVKAVDTGLFKINLKSIPEGTVVTSVTFSVYVEDTFGGPFFHLLEVAKRHWNPAQATWITASTGNPWTTQGGDVGAAQLGNDDIITSEIGTYQVFVNDPDFVALVQRWLDDPGTNRGFIMRRTYGNTTQYAKLTTMEGPENQRPILTINGKPLPWPPPCTVFVVR